MKPATPHIIKKVNATHIHVLNQIYKCKRCLNFNLDEQKYSVHFSFKKKNVESTTSIVVCIDDRLYYNLTLENEFISNVFGDYCSLEEMLQLPAYIRNIALEVAAERFLNSFDQYCDCKSDIVELSEENQFENELICIQFELLRENDKASFNGSIKTNHEGMAWFLEKFNGLPRVHERKVDQIPLTVDFELGYALLKINEIRDVELNDIILLDDRLSPERSHINVNIGSSIIFNGRIGSSGNIVIEDKAIQRMEEDMEKEENKHILHVESLIEDILVKLAFKVGETQMKFAELMDLQPGYTFETDNGLEKPVEISANGKPVGMGELVEIGDRLGVRVLEFEYKKSSENR